MRARSVSPAFGASWRNCTEKPEAAVLRRIALLKNMLQLAQRAPGRSGAGSHHRGMATAAAAWPGARASSQGQRHCRHREQASSDIASQPPWCGALSCSYLYTRGYFKIASIIV
jgi:hypothetical protein